MIKTLFTASSLAIKKQVATFSSSPLWKPIQSTLSSTLRQSGRNNSINCTPKRNLSTTQVHEEASNPLNDEDRNRRWLIGAGIAVVVIALEPYLANKFLDRRTRKLERLTESNTPDYTVSEKIRRMTLRGRAATDTLSKSDKVLQRVIKGLYSEDIDVQENSLISLLRLLNVGGKRVAEKIDTKTCDKIVDYYFNPERPNYKGYATLILNSLIINNYPLVQSSISFMPKFEELSAEAKNVVLNPSVSVFNFRDLASKVLQASAFGLLWGSTRWFIAIKRGKPLLPNVPVLRGAALAALGAGALVLLNEPLRVFKMKVLDSKNENTITFAILNLASVGLYAGSLFVVLAIAPYSFVPSLFTMKPMRVLDENNLFLSINLPDSLVIPKRYLLVMSK